MQSQWRRVARETIRRVLATNPADPEKAVREAYPFGAREMWPYKVWLEEVHQVFPPKRKTIDVRKLLWTREE